ncbi:MAG TPA: DUF2608 domain-containing protein [Dokdonella sp.]|nr:DUF2608 domain-containing protein [Dokdonella sp.]
MRAYLAVLALALAACAPLKTQKTTEAPFLPSIVNLREATKAVYAAPKPALVVLDIDDTLLSTTKLGSEHAFYGSDRWYRWQDAQGEDGPHRVPCLLDVLYWNSEVVPLEAVQPDAPEVINALSEDRLILTSRGGNQRLGTQRALAAAGYSHGKALPGLEAITTLPGTYSPMTYSDGILMTGGTKKGPALTALLANAATRYRSVVMVDDDSKNLRSVASSLAQQPESNRMEFVGLRYIGIKDEPVPPPTTAAERVADESWIAWKGWFLKYEPEPAARLMAKRCSY